MRTATLTEIETRSGRLIDLLNIEPGDIDIVDIVTSLAYQNRFSGSAGLHYSVAQHSMLVCDLLDADDQIHGLLHDAPEFLIGDLSSPIKCALKIICPGFTRAFKWIEHKAEVAIYDALGVPLPTDEQRRRVKSADMEALAIEQREIMRSPNLWNVPPAPPISITPLPAREALSLYLMRLAALGATIPGLARAA